VIQLPKTGFFSHWWRCYYWSSSVRFFVVQIFRGLNFQKFLRIITGIIWGLQDFRWLGVYPYNKVRVLPAESMVARVCI